MIVLVCFNMWNNLIYRCLSGIIGAYSTVVTYVPRMHSSWIYWLLPVVNLTWMLMHNFPCIQEKSHFQWHMVMYKIKTLYESVNMIMLKEWKKVNVCHVTSNLHNTQWMFAFLSTYSSNQWSSCKVLKIKRLSSWDDLMKGQMKNGNCAENLYVWNRKGMNKFWEKSIPHPQNIPQESKIGIL